MEEIKLDVQIRKEVGSQQIKEMRQNGFVPAIVYGGDAEPTSIKVERRGYEKIMRAHRGQSVVFHLNVMEDGKKVKDYSVILKEEQHDPVTDVLRHIDFHRISLTDKIEVKVPVESKGDAVGVKTGGGSLDHLIWELDVVCLPTDIPERIVVDISALNIGDAIHVRDLVLPSGVVTQHDPDAVVFSVVHSMKEEAEPVVEASAEPEVIGKKKEDGTAKAAESKES